MPHAPLLLPEVGGSRGAAVVEAVKGIDLSGADVIVIASPHGSATGVYRAPAGNLDAFGPRGLAAAARGDDARRDALAEAWGKPLLGEPADHGVVVPLRLLAPAAPVVAVAFAEGAGASEGAALADAVRSIDGTVAFVASANLSPGLDERSPLPSLEGAREDDAAVLAALRESPERVLAPPGSCAAPVLAAFGALFTGRPCDVRAYEHPFGVGYVVAVTP